MSLREQAVALRDQGMTNGEIARALGVHERTPWKWFGANGPNAQRDWHVRERLRRRAAELEWEGASVREIAAVLGVPRSTIHDWLRRFR